MGEKTGWLADIDPTQLNGHIWQPTLQTDGVAVDIEIWFETETACLNWIREHVIGAGMYDEPESP